MRITYEILKARLTYLPNEGIFIQKPVKYLSPERIGMPTGRSGTNGRVRIEVAGQTYARSHLAFLWMTGELPDYIVEHLNGNISDDRWNNLILSSRRTANAYLPRAPRPTKKVKLRTTRVEQRALSDARQRCHNPESKDYPYYGARGIKVLLTTQELVADIGLRPHKGLSLDRINNDGDYCVGNCRWATHSEQMRNRRKPNRATTDSW